MEKTKILRQFALGIAWASSDWLVPRGVCQGDAGADTGECDIWAVSNFSPGAGGVQQPLCGLVPSHDRPSLDGLPRLQKICGPGSFKLRSGN